VELTVTSRQEGPRTVVAVRGEIDVYTAPVLRERLSDLVSSGQYHLVLDLEGVDFLDSTGLGVLVGALKRVRPHDGEIVLVCAQERILKVFRITGLTSVFPIHETLDGALGTASPTDGTTPEEASGAPSANQDAG
jgi:anti-sigma B factor antagonist